MQNGECMMKIMEWICWMIWILDCRNKVLEYGTMDEECIYTSALLKYLHNHAGKRGIIVTKRIQIVLVDLMSIIEDWLGSTKSKPGGARPY